MKHLIFIAAMAMASTFTYANHPDSVWVRPDVKNGTRDFQIAYSIDQKHWTHVPCNLFESDYGTWGSEKKLFYPVLSYDGNIYRVVFIPSLKNGQLAITESEDFALWKPQDYPYLSESEFQKIVATQENVSKTNIVRVPYSAIQNLMAKKIRADRNGAWERDNFVASGSAIAQSAEPIEATLTVNWNDRKAISPNLMGIFFEDISYAADGGLYAELIQNRDFEYTADDHRGWDAQTAWKLIGNGTTWRIETTAPIHKNNAHYSSLITSTPGSKLMNGGWDGIPLQKGKKYNLSLFTKGAGSIRVSLMNEDGNAIANTTLKATKEWQQQKNSSNSFCFS